MIRERPAPTEVTPHVAQNNTNRARPLMVAPLGTAVIKSVNRSATDRRDLRLAEVGGLLRKLRHRGTPGELDLYLRHCGYTW